MHRSITTLYDPRFELDCRMSSYKAGMYKRFNVEPDRAFVANFVDHYILDQSSYADAAKPVALILEGDIDLL